MSLSNSAFFIASVRFYTPCPWKREDHAACFPFLTLSNSDSASCSADFSIDTLCSSSSTVPLFRADLYGVRKSREKFCKAWTPQTWKTHLQALTHIVNWNKRHCGLPDYLPLLKVRAAWWCWSRHITYGTDQYISVAFLSVLLAILTQQLPPIKVSTLNQQKDWKCLVRCSGGFFLKYKFSRSFRQTAIFAWRIFKLAVAYLNFQKSFICQ